MRTSAPSRRYGGKTAEQRRRERRAALVTAAGRIWREQGWAAVTMRGVCARAGLTDRYFYESFADRDDLLAAVWDEVRDRTLAMLLSAIQASPDPGALGQLRAALHAIVHHIEDDPAEAQVLFGDHAGSAVLEQRRRDTVQLATDLMTDLARPFLAAGADQLALRLNILLGIGGFTEVVLAWRSGVVELTADQVVDHLADVAGALGSRFLAE